jgi:hypothetical protein
MAELPHIDTLFLVGDESRIRSEMQALGCVVVEDP